jgi:protein-tyrosine phosphatase
MSNRAMPDDPDRKELTSAARRAWSESSSLLFVCLGNFCRSPFAEHLARNHLDAEKRLSSAGTYPVGRGAPADAIAAARPFGVDLSAHRSRVLSPQILGRADAVFVFDPGNHRAVLSQQPVCAPRVHWLGALTEGGPLVLSDPFGGSASEFELVYRQIAAAVEAGGAV